VYEAKYIFCDIYQYEAAEKQSYNELFAFVRRKLFVDPDVVPLIDLTSRLVLSMNALGVTQVKPSTKKYIHRKLEAEFGEALHIFSDKGKLILHPDSHSMSKLAKAYHTFQAELQIMKSVRIDDSIDKAGMKMRRQE